MSHSGREKNRHTPQTGPSDKQEEAKGHIGGKVVIMKVPRIEGLSEKEEGTRGFMRDTYLLDKMK